MGAAHCICLLMTSTALEVDSAWCKLQRIAREPVHSCEALRRHEKRVLPCLPALEARLLFAAYTDTYPDGINILKIDNLPAQGSE